MTQCLVVWDFDWSLVNENSDVYIVQQLAPDLMPEFSQLKAQGLGWTQIVAKQMESLWQRGFREQDIIACLAQLPLQPRMLDTVNLINSSGAMQVLCDSIVGFLTTRYQMSEICMH
jgi:pyridoxal phosphate phosphatase PHOSPHO2